MAKSKKKQEGVGMWVAIVVLFVLGAWPIALILLLVKLFGDDGKKKRTAAPPLNQAASAGTAAAEDSRAKKVMRSAMRSPAVKKSNAKWLKIIGAVLAVCGLAASWSPIDMMIWLGGVEIWYIEELLWALAITAAGVAMFCSGMSIDRSLKRYNKYLAVVGDYEAMAVEQLSRTLGYPRDRVEKDLQKMIDKGYFGDEAYLNMELGYLFRSGQADAELKQKRRQEQAQEAAAAPPPKETEEGYSGILRRIRRANDAIADEALSAKIDRLETITAKIFRAVEEDPKKRDRIDTFMNYYLPTTQKLLDSYAEFEAAGVEGENLRQAKARIESTMDLIIKGFEHQLDELYKADALDVDSDIRVMETMLERDTASVEKDFGLGEHGRRGKAPADRVKKNRCGSPHRFLRLDRPIPRPLPPSFCTSPHRTACPAPWWRCRIPPQTAGGRPPDRR